MKKEIYITILLFALMLFALAVTVVEGHSIDPGQTKKIGFDAITNKHQIEMNPILPGRVNVSNFIAFPEAYNKRKDGIRVNGCVLSPKLIETGFVGCELEQPILIRAAPFTRPLPLRSV